MWRLGVPGKGVIEQFRIEHGPAGVARLVARVSGAGAGPGRGAGGAGDPPRAAGRGAVDAGFTVLPVNPDLVARRRGPAKKKDDAEDARICCLLALDQYAELRKLIPHGELGGELRAIARDDERAARDERRLVNRLRADLLAAFPAAIDIADGDLGARGVPAPAGTLAHASRAGRRRPRRASKPSPAPTGTAGPTGSPTGSAPRWPHRSCPRAPSWPGPRPAASGWPPRSCCCCASQRRGWQRRMGELLLGAPATGAAKQPKDPEPGNAFPGGEIYLSMPGLG